MILFIIPLKSKTVSSDWSKVSYLLENTLRSVCNQTSQNFRVAVICHEKPIVQFEHENISYIQVNFPPPETNNNSKTLNESIYKAGRLDQSRKYWVGLEYAKEISPSHIMFVDADDYINKHIASFVEQNINVLGWHVCKGYEYKFGDKKIYLRNKKFYLRSGTSHILQFQLLLDLFIDFELVDHNYLRHQKLFNLLKKQGVFIECLPFIGAIYVTENSENARSQLKYYFQRSKNVKGRFLLLFRRFIKSLLSESITFDIRENFGFWEASSVAEYRSINMIKR